MLLSKSSQCVSDNINILCPNINTSHCKRLYGPYDTVKESSNNRTSIVTDAIYRDSDKKEEEN